jgi:hypothetical protein
MFKLTFMQVQHVFFRLRLPLLALLQNSCQNGYTLNANLYNPTFRIQSFY